MKPNALCSQFVLSPSPSNYRLRNALFLQALKCWDKEVYELATYHFDGTGKALRPQVVLLLANAINFHLGLSTERQSAICEAQKRVAMVAEMIHTAALIHDDVVDHSDLRRGKPSAARKWGQKKV